MFSKKKELLMSVVAMFCVLTLASVFTSCCFASAVDGSKCDTEKTYVTRDCTNRRALPLPPVPVTEEFLPFPGSFIYKCHLTHNPDNICPTEPKYVGFIWYFPWNVCPIPDDGVAIGIPSDWNLPTCK